VVTLAGRECKLHIKVRESAEATADMHGSFLIWD